MPNISESTVPKLIMSVLSSLALASCLPTDHVSLLGVYDGGASASLLQADAAPAAEPSPEAAVPAADAALPVPSEAAAPQEAGLSFEPIVYDDPSLRCYALTAHAAADQAQPYQVEATGDLYVNYTFAAPWQGTRAIRSIRPIISQAEVIHRSRLFADSGALPAGVAVSARNHRGAQLIATWMPGGEAVYFKENSGILASDAVSYTLEIHYNNVSERAVPDASGFELCVSEETPRFLLGLAQLGGDEADGSYIRNLCTPDSSESIQVYGLRPQLSAHGRRVNVTLLRASGATEAVLDEPFQFDRQRSYATRFEINAGDTVRTTCSFQGPAKIGPGVADSACNIYAYHSAAGLLQSRGNDSLEGVGTCRD